MSIKTYPDGSELTVTGLAVGVVAGAVMAAAIIYLQEKNNTRKTKKIMKKYGWPQQAIDRI